MLPLLLLTLDLGQPLPEPHPSLDDNYVWKWDLPRGCLYSVVEVEKPHNRSPSSERCVRVSIRVCIKRHFSFQ